MELIFKYVGVILYGVGRSEFGRDGYIVFLLLLRVCRFCYFINYYFVDYLVYLMSLECYRYMCFSIIWVMLKMIDEGDSVVYLILFLINFFVLKEDVWSLFLWYVYFVS